MILCVVEGCQQDKHPKAGYGLCSTHYWRKYREENRSRLDSNYKEWKTKRGSRWARMPERERNELRAHNARRRALTKGTQVFIVTMSDLNKLRALYRFCCAYCSSKTPVPHWDHVTPLVLGGTHSIGNLLPSCETCNKSKGSATLTEWRYALLKGLPVPRHNYRKFLFTDSIRREATS